MTAKIFRSNNLHAFRGLLLAIFFGSCIEVVAQTTYTWNGLGADDDWSTALNWAGLVAPTDAGSDANLIFGVLLVGLLSGMSLQPRALALTLKVSHLLAVLALSIS